MPMEQLNVIRVQNYLDTPMKMIKLNFIYNNEMIGELEVSYGIKPSNLESNQFLNLLCKAETIGEFQHHLLMKFDSLASERLIYTSKFNSVENEQRAESLFCQLAA